jgi:hypothetical protein
VHPVREQTTAPVSLACHASCQMRAHRAAALAVFIDSNAITRQPPGRSRSHR